jgi:predicted Zn-dependent protease with MMP-like domain
LAPVAVREAPLCPGQPGARARRPLPTGATKAYLLQMTNPAADSIAPSLAFIEQLAHEAISTLPAPFREPATQIRLRVEEFADEEMVEELGVEDPFELTGLYDGIPLTEKSVADQVTRPDVIWLFRRPILDEWAERGDVSISDLVAHVVIHELAHHFGWSDEEIASIDRWWE